MLQLGSLPKTSKERPMSESPPPAYQDLPSVSALLESAPSAALLRRWGHQLTKDALQTVLGAARSTMASGVPAPTAIALLAAADAHLEQRTARGPRPVLNLSGTLLHTNLGRAPLSPAAMAAVAAAAGPVDLEFDLRSGKRGQRDAASEALLCALTGAEAAAIVNNNAAAVLLVLNTFGLGQEVIVSRGELVEIGGSFRIPDIMARAGARLREVGTTNRTHLRDFADALGSDTGLLMKVHPSNYALVGYTSEVSLAALAQLGKAQGIPTAYDLGAGSLLDLRRYNLPEEPRPQDALKAGIDVVTFSADKLLGGPQAGLLVGSRKAITALRKNPLYRALRVDKLRLAALRETLVQWDRPEPEKHLPTLAYLLRPRRELSALAEALLDPVQERLGDGWAVRVVPLESQVGSGAQPATRLESAGLALRPTQGGPGAALEGLAAALRALPLPVLGRIADGALLLDLRTLDAPETLLKTLAELPRTEP